MTTQFDRATELKNLHRKGAPLILFNIWDAGSALAVQASGATAIATGSWSVAAAHGYKDGENLAFDFVLSNLKRIIACVELPVTIDLEGGYSHSLDGLRENIVKVIDAGAVGINFEDQIVGGENLYSIEEQCSRIRVIRETAEDAGVPIFINARTDVFLKLDPAEHNTAHLAEALQRASAYYEAGASGFFAPGLRNPDYIRELCENSSVPVNILVLPDTPSMNQLVELGVSRISYGPAPYRHAMGLLEEAARKVLNF